MAVRAQGRISLSTPLLLVGVLGCILLKAPRALAQTESATVTGRVTDQTGAVVPDAEIELKNADTNISQNTKTNGDGVYAFASVKPGNYIMSVHKAQFRTVSVTGMTLNVQEK